MSGNDDLLGSFDPSQTSKTEEKKPSNVGSFRDSLNLEDFEKVDADLLDQGSAFASNNPVADAGGKGSDPTIGGVKEVGEFIGDKMDTVLGGLQSSEVPFLTDKLSEDFINKENMEFDESAVVGIKGDIEESKVEDFLSGAPKSEELKPAGVSQDWSTEGGLISGVGDISGSSPAVGLLDDKSSGLLADNNEVVDFLQQQQPSGTIESFKESDPFGDYSTESKVSGKTDEPLFQQDVQDIPSQFSAAPVEAPMVAEVVKEQQQAFEPPRQPSPYGALDSPPREPSPMQAVRDPSPVPREPTPPPREPTPPPREPTPPPRKPTPPPREPTPPPREPTPPPKEPTPPPREPTPPPREPTPPPREPTPPPREPTPPPREPTPPPREPTPPPREPTPPLQKPLTTKDATPSLATKPKNSSGESKSYLSLDAETRRKFAMLNPIAELIYWRDVKKSGIVLASSLILLFSLTWFSLISVFAYTALSVLVGAVTFRIYMNVKQAVQKTQDGHPFKEYLAVNPALPSDHVHSAIDVMLGQLNAILAYLHRIFLVEDLIDSCKFGCYLWVLTYVGAWLNGLTIIILAVIALFSLPKAYEQNKTQVDQYVGLVQEQVNQVLEKVKALIPIGGNKEKDQ